MPFTFTDTPGPTPCHAYGETLPTEPKPAGWHVAFHTCTGA